MGSASSLHSVRTARGAKDACLKVSGLPLAHRKMKTESQVCCVDVKGSSQRLMQSQCPAQVHCHPSTITISSSQGHWESQCASIGRANVHIHQIAPKGASLPSTGSSSSLWSRARKLKRRPGETPRGLGIRHWAPVLGRPSTCAYPLSKHF